MEYRVLRKHNASFNKYNRLCRSSGPAGNRDLAECIRRFRRERLAAVPAPDELVRARVALRLLARAGLKVAAYRYLLTGSLVRLHSRIAAVQGVDLRGGWAGGRWSGWRPAWWRGCYSR